MALDSLIGVGLRPLPGLAPPLVFIERHPDHQADRANAHCDTKESYGKHGKNGFDHMFSFGGVQVWMSFVRLPHLEQKFCSVRCGGVV